MREMREKQKLLHVHKNMYNDDEQSNIFFFESHHFVSKIEDTNKINDIGILLRQSETHIPTYWLVHFVAGKVVVMDENSRMCSVTSHDV